MLCFSGKCAGGFGCAPCPTCRLRSGPGPHLRCLSPTFFLFELNLCELRGTRHCWFRLLSGGLKKLLVVSVIVSGNDNF